MDDLASSRSAFHPEYRKLEKFQTLHEFHIGQVLSKQQDRPLIHCVFRPRRCK